MSYEVLTDKTVSIRKPHQCVWCLRKFEKGAEMEYQSGKCDGDFYSCYNCKTCSEIVKFYRDDMEDGGWPEGFVREFLKKDQTPEQLLQELKEEKDARTQRQPDKTSRDRYSLLQQRSY